MFFMKVKKTCFSCFYLQTNVGSSTVLECQRERERERERGVQKLSSNFVDNFLTDLGQT